VATLITAAGSVSGNRWHTVHRVVHTGHGIGVGRCQGIRRHLAGQRIGE